MVRNPPSWGHLTLKAPFWRLWVSWSFSLWHKESWTEGLTVARLLGGCWSGGALDSGAPPLSVLTGAAPTWPGSVSLSVSPPTSGHSRTVRMWGRHRNVQTITTSILLRSRLYLNRYKYIGKIWKLQKITVVGCPEVLLLPCRIKNLFELKTCSTINIYSRCNYKKLTCNM